MEIRIEETWRKRESEKERFMWETSKIEKVPIFQKMEKNYEWKEQESELKRRKQAYEEVWSIKAPVTLENIKNHSSIFDEIKK